MLSNADAACSDADMTVLEVGLLARGLIGN